LNNIVDLEIWVRGHFKIIEIGAIQKLKYSFLFAFYSNYDRICSRCEIFSIKEWCDLETGLWFVQGHWNWHHL